MNFNRATRTDPLLVVDQVTKSYGRIKALDGVSLSISGGEFTALLGANGAGKSTLFQLLTGLFVPDDGEITVMGQNIRHNAVPALAGLGIVFQQPTVDPELSVISNLRFHTKLHGLDGNLASKRIAAELARVDLSDRINDPVRTLSGGNRRRIELARALLHNPQVLLMDEPTVGLDPQSRSDILNYVLHLRKEKGIAVLWATHLVDEAEHADRIIVLHRGRVLRDSTPSALISETGSQSVYEAFLQLTRGGEAEETLLSDQ